MGARETPSQDAPCKEDKGDDADRPHVHGLSVGLPPQDFGGYVAVGRGKGEEGGREGEGRGVTGAEARVRTSAHRGLGRRREARSQAPSVQ